MIHMFLFNKIFKPNQAIFKRTLKKTSFAGLGALPTDGILFWTGGPRRSGISLRSTSPVPTST
jgi:hypothetical protein